MVGSGEKGFQRRLKYLTIGKVNSGGVVEVVGSVERGFQRRLKYPTLGGVNNG